MRSWRIEPFRGALRGALRLPGDKSIGHRALLFGALASGSSELRNLSAGEDNASTRSLLEALGVTFEALEGGGVRVHGVGLEGLRAPSRTLDCGNSGTTMRLAVGLLAAQHFDSVLTGDASLSRRPMARVLKPLRSRGARVDGAFDPRRNDETAPLTVRGLREGLRLGALEHAMQVSSAQVKSCLLLSGLRAAGPTSLNEPLLSRDHTERMLRAMGAPLETLGTAVQLDPTEWDGRLEPQRFDLPGDLSSATFWLVAAHLCPGSRIAVRDCGLNPTRAGSLDVLRDMGGSIALEPKGERCGEPVGDIHVGAWAPAEFRSGARVAGELAVRCLDEVPALVAAAAHCYGAESVFSDLRELRVKESDRIAALVRMLRAFGLEAQEQPEGLTLRGSVPRGGAVIDSEGDHRIAMSAALVALRAEGPTVVRDVGCVATSYPSFARLLGKLGVSIEEREED